MAEELFNKDKEKNVSEWYFELLKKAEVVDQRYPVKGLLVHREIAAVAEREIYRLYEEELEKTGHKLHRFPSLIPLSVFAKEMEHVEGFTPEVFWIEKAGDDELPEKLGLRPTSEAVVHTMMSEWIRSWRDLPLKTYQECQVWRYETKHTRPLLRDREFYWIETHNAFATREEAEKQVLEDMEITEKVLHEQLALPFLFFKRPDWDKFKGAVHTYAADVVMPNGIVIQQPSTHFLGQNFARAYDVKFVDDDGKEHYVWHTCYGPAISRILASVIMMHGDNKGLKFPWSIAPYQVVIVPVLKKEADKQAVIEKCKQLYEKLKEKKIRVVLDLSDKRPGMKYYYWELKGACLRFEIGPKEAEKGFITVARRDTGKKEKVKEEELDEYLKRVPEEFLANLRKEADVAFKKCIHEAKTLKEVKKILDEKGGFVRVEFCSRDFDGEECAEKLRIETNGGKVRGTLVGGEEKPKGKCIVCGKPARAVVYVAREY